MKKVLSRILIGAGFILEVLLWPMAFGSVRIEVIFALHLMAVFFLLAGLYLEDASYYRMARNRPILFFAVVLTLAFPGLGLWGALFLYIAVFRRLGQKFYCGIYDDYEKHIQERSIGTFKGDLRGDFMKQFRDELSFKPFADVMAGHEIHIKARVIEKLSRTLLPENIAMIRAATRDLSTDVRLYAANALLKMQNNVEERIQRVLKAQREGNAKGFSDLGDLYRVYAESGILEKILARYYLKLSCEAYRNSLDIDTNQPHTIAHYTRCLLRLEEYSVAKRMLDHAYSLWPQNTEIVFLRNEVYFNLGIFDDIGHSLAQSPVDHLGEAQQEVVKFWTSEN